MLKLYYTGAVKFNKPQFDPSKSIGGYISSSEVSNGMLSNLFGEVSNFTVRQNKPETRVIAVKNASGATKTGIKVFFTYPQVDGQDDNVCDFEIGYISPEVDNCGDLKTEQLNSIYANPYSVAFQAGRVGLVNAIDLPNMDVNQYITIWIRRKLKASLQNPMSNADLLAVMEGSKIISTLEDISLTLQWN
jgi:hypothetical protein